MTGQQEEFSVVRVYDQDEGDDAYRVLVDRLWPRGLSKVAARVDHWAKDVAPSTGLRRWYGHDAARFEEFARRYREELARPPASDAVSALRRLPRGQRVALVTATRDLERSGASVLCRVLKRKGGPWLDIAPGPGTTSGPERQTRERRRGATAG